MSYKKQYKKLVKQHNETMDHAIDTIEQLNKDITALLSENERLRHTNLLRRMACTNVTLSNEALIEELKDDIDFVVNLYKVPNDIIQVRR